MAQDVGWVGKKPLRRLGGMADALAIATELGYSVPQEDAVVQNATPATAKSDALVSVLRELTTVQRNLANLQVELQGRQDDESVSHLTHVSEIEKKCRALAKTTSILRDVIQNKDRIIARLQQPYSLDCIPVETEYQKQFAELLLKAAGDYGALTASISDLQWTQNYKEPPSAWGYYEALSAMREAVRSLYKLRVRCAGIGTPLKDISCASDKAESECMTPQSWNQENYLLDEPNSDDLLMRARGRYKQLDIAVEDQEWGTISEASQPDSSTEDLKQRRMSWPPSPSSLGTAS